MKWIKRFEHLLVEFEYHEPSRWIAEIESITAVWEEANIELISLSIDEKAVELHGMINFKYNFRPWKEREKALQMYNL